MKLKKKAILYLEGMLNEEERVQFINDIKNRPDIHEFIQEYRWLESRLNKYLDQKNNPDGKEKKETDLDDLTRADIDKYLKYHQNKNKDREKEFLAMLTQNRLERENASVKNYSFILNIAASIALLALIIGGLLHVINVNKSKEYNSNIFAEYFSPWEDGNIREYESSFVIIENNGLNLTKKGQDISTDQLNTILRSDRMSSEDILLISILLIQENELSMAETYLKDILEKSAGKLSESARYYLSLLYIRKGALDKSIQNLEIICEENGGYSDVSCKLLGTLNKKNLD